LEFDCDEGGAFACCVIVDKLKGEICGMCNLRAHLKLACCPDYPLTGDDMIIWNRVVYQFKLAQVQEQETPNFFATTIVVAMCTFSFFQRLILKIARQLLHGALD